MTMASHDAHLPVSHGFEEWRDAVSSAFVPLNSTTAQVDKFSGMLTTHPIGALQINIVGGGSVTVARNMKAIRRSDPEYYKFGLQVRGYCVVTQDGREAALTPGDLALYDTSRPYALSFESDFRMLVFMFPRNLLRVNPRRAEALTARRISGRQGLGAVVAPFLLQLGHELEAGKVVPSSELSDAVLDLVAATLAEQLHEGNEPSGTYRQALLLQIKAFIDARLGDADLNSSTIAQAHHISVRYLQKLFEAEGTTTTDWVRSRRLERCRRDLANPLHKDVGISNISGMWGLLDASHFSRTFKITYGLSPREYRRTMTTAQQGPAAPSL